jgi:hypothetical protein
LHSTFNRMKERVISLKNLDMMDIEYRIQLAIVLGEVTSNEHETVSLSRKHIEYVFLAFALAFAGK